MIETAREFLIFIKYYFALEHLRNQDLTEQEYICS